MFCPTVMASYPIESPSETFTTWYSSILAPRKQYEIPELLAEKEILCDRG